MFEESVELHSLKKGENKVSPPPVEIEDPLKVRNPKKKRFCECFNIFKDTYIEYA